MRDHQAPAGSELDHGLPDVAGMKDPAGLNDRVASGREVSGRELLGR